MRYLSAAMFALAAAGHTAGLVNMLALGLLVAAGVLAMMFGIEAMIAEALRHERALEPTPCATPHLNDAELRELFNIQPATKERPCP